MFYKAEQLSKFFLGNPFEPNNLDEATFGNYTVVAQLGFALSNNGIFAVGQDSDLEITANAIEGTIVNGNNKWIKDLYEKIDGKIKVEIADTTEWNIKGKGKHTFSLELARGLALVKIYNYLIRQEQNILNYQSLGEILKNPIKNTLLNKIRPAVFIKIVERLVEVYDADVVIAPWTSISFITETKELFDVFGEDYVRSNAMISDDLFEIHQFEAKLVFFQYLYIAGKGYYLPKVILPRLLRKPFLLYSYFHTIIVAEGKEKTPDPKEVYFDWIILFDSEIN